MDIAFESSYPTPYSASPLLPLLLLSLACQRNSPRAATTFKEEYDYIIVGGGSAGSTLASRLSEESCISVLLLEAGTANIPLLNDVPALGRSFWFTNLDWQYKTVPQKRTGSGLINRQVIWPSGKGIGGSSLLNEMLYIRGNHKNYDDWAAQGAKGWSFKDVLPYFLKMEDNRNPKFLANGYHAFGGPITVEEPRYESELKCALTEAAQELGYRIGDSNAAYQTGFHEIQNVMRNGQRCSTAKAYLVPAENRTNLDILAGAHVRKIILDGRRAVGVQFDFQNNTYSVRAKREVIMSAGTTNTAQLLMLSGIGPKEHLEAFQIPVVADLPVGNNFQDHCGAFLHYQLSPEITPAAQKIMDPQNIREYIYSRSGPLSSVLPYNEFLNSRPVPTNTDFPDFQMYIAEVPKELFQQQTGLRPEVYSAIFTPYENATLLVCLAYALQPKSRGTVRLQSTDPYDSPVIDPNYFENEEDVKITVEAMKTCQRIARSESMRKIGTKPFETVYPGCEEFVGDEEAYFTCVVRAAVVTMSHHVGTVKMGDPKDPTTVVDPFLRVKSIKGLRVVDASVMPIIPSGNTNIPTIMVAEKAADIIKKTIRCPSNGFSHYEFAYAQTHI